MIDILIIDDCIDKNQQNVIEQTMLSNEFAWFFHDTANSSGEDLKKIKMPVIPKNAKDFFQFTHNFYANKMASNYFNHINPILNSIPIKIKKIIRIKSNFRIYSKENEKYIGIPHTDYIDPPENQITGVYYVNESSGETII